MTAPTTSFELVGPSSPEPAPQGHRPPARGDERGAQEACLLRLDTFGPYDAAEERDFRRGLERAGFGSDLTRDDMEALGFYVCVADLEDELIRSLGATAVEHIIDAQGELRSFRTLQQQPAQQGRTIEQQLRRFMGTRGGRKIQYAPVLVEALDLTRVPRSLDRVLAHV
ncbi:MAG: hypothetical protein H0X22_07070 [Acidimicrobiia bacterium]|nr:hypothetical protein [Acidimicrobiia bacterium]